MLTSLSIRNFALIDHLEVDFSSGFSVITGETGTGKSVFLGAISMMLGQRSDAKSVREGADRCIIEGHFDLSSFDMRSFFDENELEYDECDCIVRRELSSSGRSRAFINDTPVSVSLLKELGAKLIDVHSQHQNLLLGDKHFQLGVLDTLSAGDVQLSLYRECYSEWCSINKELAALQETLEYSRRDEEWLRFQLEELDGAALVDGEQEALEQELFYRTQGFLQAAGIPVPAMTNESLYPSFFASTSLHNRPDYQKLQLLQLLPTRFCAILFQRSLKKDENQPPKISATKNHYPQLLHYLGILGTFGCLSTFFHELHHRLLSSGGYRLFLAGNRNKSGNKDPFCRGHCTGFTAEFRFA